MLVKKLVGLTIFLIFFLTGVAFAEMTGLDIMKKSDGIDDSKSQKSTMTMELVDKNGKIRSRKLVRIVKEVKEGNKSLTTFLDPKDIAGTSFLSFGYNEMGKPDDQWIYLPSIGKPRRVSAADKGEYFMGTEFTYDDQGDRNPEEDVHEIKGSETVNGKDCYKIISKPKDEDYMYSKKVNYVDKESFVQIKVDYYDEDEEFLKTRTARTKLIDNIWTPVWVEMKNHQKNRATVIKFDNVQYNLPIKNSMFTQRMLKKGLKE